MMSSHKRSVSQSEDPSALPNKSAKFSASPDTEQLLALAWSENQGLRNHIAELYGFIDNSGLALDAPHHIQKHMDARENAAKTLATQISNRMSDAQGELYGDTCNARKTGVTSDDLSQAMMPFFSDIERLRDIPGSTTLAYGLAKEMANNSYGELDGGGCGNGDRPSDLEVDDLLGELAIARRREDTDWNFLNDLEQLEEDAKHLQDYGIEDFCSQTIELMSAWRDEKPQLEIAHKVAGARGGSCMPYSNEGHHPLSI